LMAVNQKRHSKPFYNTYARKRQNVDRRKEDRGGYEDYRWSTVTIMNRRSGQDRRKHDMLGEAREWNLKATGCAYTAAAQLNILIMMERRGK